MFEELKLKIAHYLIRKKYLRKSDERIVFKTAIKDAKELFIIMPDNPLDFTESLEVVKFFNLHKKDISIFVNEAKHSDVPINHGYKFVPYLPTQVNRIFLPDKMLINRLSEKHFDLVIDLNRQEAPFFSCVSNIVTSKIRIGFRKNRSDEYYNLMFDCKQEDPSLAYKKFLEHLNMF